MQAFSALVSFVGCTNFNLLRSLQDRMRLRNTQIYLVFRSAFTIFARTKKSRVYEIASLRTLAIEVGSYGGREAVSSGV